MNDPFVMACCPWLPNVTPTFSRVPLRAKYTVAICNTEALLADLSDWKKDMSFVVNREKKKRIE